jgi:hypothetical protein
MTFRLELAEQALHLDLVANVLLVALVLRVDGNGGIAELCLRPHGGQHKRTILDVVQRIDLLPVLNLNIRESGVAPGTPVNDSITAINQPVIKQAPKGVINDLNNIGIKGEFEPAPVAEKPKLFNWLTILF